MAAHEPDLGRGPHAGLLTWLSTHGIEHEVHEHAETFTAQETARTEQIDPRTFAKTLAVATDDGRRALLVVDAVDQLDLAKAAVALRARHVRLLTETELAELAPSCDVGAIPPIGELFGLPVIVDHAIREDAEITFHAGSHRAAVRVDREAWARQAGVEYGDLARETDRPAWA